MKNTRISRLIAIVVILVFLAITAEAQHHSYAADYDRNQSISVTGKITKIEFSGSRVWLFINAENANGEIEPWSLEVFSTSHLLYLNGWTKDTLKLGDVVSVRGWKAKTTSSTGNKGLASEVIFNGKNLVP